MVVPTSNYQPIEPQRTPESHIYKPAPQQRFTPSAEANTAAFLQTAAVHETKLTVGYAPALLPDDAPAKILPSPWSFLAEPTASDKAPEASKVASSDKPVKAGDKWEVPVDMELPKIGKLKGKTTFTCEGPDKVGDRKTVRLGVTTDHAFDLNAEQGGAKVTGTMTTTNSTGTVQFDPEAGRVVSIKRTFAMSGQLSVDVNGMAIPVDSQQEQTVALELLDKLP